MKQGRASLTARWVATKRSALHDTRPSRGDADAELRLYQSLSIPLLGSRLTDPVGMEVRTRFIDRQVVAGLDHGVRQVVVIGAGYDCRSLRFSDAPARWFEVDHPSTQLDKLDRLRRVGAAADHISFVALDLMQGDLGSELDAAGHDTVASTLWLCEGLFPYLPPPVIGQLCRTLSERSTDDSKLVCNILVRATGGPASGLIRGAVDRLLAGIGERRLAEFAPGDIEALLDESGWCVSEKEQTNPSRIDGAHLAVYSAIPKRS